MHVKANLRSSVLRIALASAACVCLHAEAWSATTINFLAAEPDATFQPVIAGFEKLHPDIKVIYQSIPFDDLNAAIRSRIGEGDTSIDVYGADTPRIPSFASSGYMLDLSDRRAAIQAVVPHTSDIEQVSYNGHIYAYPMWTSTQFLYFNRDFLKAAHVASPSTDPASPMTWDALEGEATAAQKAGARWGLMFQQVDRYYQLQMLFASAGAGSGLTGPGLLTPAVNGAAWVKTAQWYGNVFKNGLGPRGVTPEQTDDLFVNKQLAFEVGGEWAIDRFNGVQGLDYGVAPVPYFGGGKPITPTGSWSLAINPHSKQIQAARAFAEYATLDGDGSYLTVTASPQIPTNAQAFQKYAQKMDGSKGRIGDVIALVTYQENKTAVVRPRSRGYVTFETVINRTFSDIRDGTDASTALNSAQRQLARALRRDQ